MEFITEILLDTFLDVIKIIPFLFLTYLFLEWMENQTGHKFESYLEHHKRLGPLAGSIFGLFPSCGFSGAASSLYTTGVISAGTLIAVYLACSDEMIAIAISLHAPLAKILPIFAAKLIVALISGYLIDTFLARHRTINVNEFCERENDDHHDGILHSALKHTIEISIWLFIITFVFNGLVEMIGTQTLRSFISAYPNQTVIVSSLIGLIPSCASSILLTTMYLEGVLSFAAVCAGLFVNAGAGLLVLFRVNPRMKDNLKVVWWTWLCGVGAGLLIELLKITF